MDQKETLFLYRKPNWLRLDVEAKKSQQMFKYLFCEFFEAMREGGVNSRNEGWYSLSHVEKDKNACVSEQIMMSETWLHFSYPAREVIAIGIFKVFQY